MKKIIFALSFAVIAIASYGQVTTQDTTKKEFKNVLSINANGFLQQFFGFNEYSYFYSPYILGYKRLFKNNALRVNIGGSLVNRSTTENDTIEHNQNRGAINIGIGYEHYVYLGKRWNFYYGADAIYRYEHSFYKNTYTNGDISENTSTSSGYGVSPLLGIHFKLSSRLSLATEASIDMLYTQYNESRTNSGTDIYNTHSKRDDIIAQFYAPTAVSFRINL